jgi:hypothetical protein
MDALEKYLDSIYSCVQIDLCDKKWHTKAQIPAEPGWYFIRSSAPLSVLYEQELWSTTYVTKRKHETNSVRNYNIGERARRYTTDLLSYWNITEVYSGMASDLLARACEHTFTDPGTGGLALSRYPALHEFEWSFGYLTVRRFLPNASCDDMILRLGEQIWRSKHGWPILCAE